MNAGVVTVRGKGAGNGAQWALATLSFLLLSAPVLRAAHSVQIEFLPRVGNAPLAFDNPALTNSAGQVLSVTRLDFLVSAFALHRAGGDWVDLTNSVGFIGARAGKTGLILSSVQEGTFDRLRFKVGIGPDLNHAEAAQFPAGHPLNPDVNGLHWSWQGGYVFLALEGRWGKPGALDGGFSYHLATDCQLMSVELPVVLPLNQNARVALALRVDEILGGTRGRRITDETATTHSRATDALASHLHENVQRAFEVASVRIQAGAGVPAVAGGRKEIAPNATPYRLTIPDYFPRPALPTDNPVTEEGVELGRRLFSETRLARNDAQSCASCHSLAAAGADAGKRLSLGAEGQRGTRNAMALMNLAWKSEFFWDGRAASLREQVLQPIQNPIEMHESLTNVVAKLSSDYRLWFARAFGTPDITADRIARALEQFLLTQTSYHAKFDRVAQGDAQFTAEEARGFELFHTEYDPRREQFGADCFHCHGGPLFQSQAYANNGLDSTFADAGRSEVTRKPGDQGKFAVPSLRNVSLTAPYMHDGRFATLEQVVEHYSTGVHPSATLDPNLAKHPVGGVPLAAPDRQALVAFLKALTDERLSGRAQGVSAATVSSISPNSPQSQEAQAVNTN